MAMGAAKDAELRISGGGLCRSQRIAILPYIEGQKYTFGDTFTSREEQGEFIFWFGGKQGGNNPGLEEGVKFDKKSTKNGTVCEIVCKDKKFWLIPLGDWMEGDVRNYVDVLFLNDVAVNTKEKQKLKFGDELSVIRTIEEVGPSTLAANQTRIHNSRIVLEFKERELLSELDVLIEKHYRKRTKRKTDNKVDLFYPGKNSLILSKILSFLDTNQLKNVRFISNIWNQEAVKILRKRTIAMFRIFPRFQTNYSGQTHACSGFYSTPFLQYNHEMKHNPIMNWDILLPHFATSDTDKYKELNCTEGKPGAKLIVDLNWFLTSRLHSVKNLTLGGPIKSTFDMTIRFQILDKLKETLQDLNFAGEWEDPTIQEDDDFTTQASISLPHLKVLTLSTNSRKTLTATSFHFFRSLIASLPRVQSLHLISHHFPTLSIYFLEELDSKFRNLDEVTLNHVSRTELELLCKFDKPLRKLALKNPYEPDFNSETIQLWERLIWKHSNTLVSLDFTMPICAAPHNGRVLHLPTFPLLKTLAVDYNIDFDYLAVTDDSRTKLPVQFHSENPGTSWLIYARHFPSLQSLKLTPLDILEQYETCSKTFFPHGATIPDQICKTLINLDIPREMASRRLAVMFPNVYNDWINKARQPAEVTNVVNDKVDFLKYFHPLTDGQPTWELLPSLLPTRYDLNVMSLLQMCDNNSSIATTRESNSDS
ncbi:uncharacterized protein LOC110850147 [Folsomia candida]|nr:uncharacterized protein LOC110850147 [Folsomia candida]